MATVPTFAVPPTFLGILRAPDEAAIHIAGIPFDIGTTNRSGARFGPPAIRAASRMLVDGDHPHWWVDPAALPVCDIGDFDIALGDIANSLALIQGQAAAHAHLVALGGDHSISLPLLRARAIGNGAPLALVHFDAHVDTWPDNFGQVYAHGSVFYHAIEEGLIDPKRTVQIGIRSPVQKDVYDWTRGKGVTVITAQDVHETTPHAVAQRVTEVIGNAPAYLSFDIDCLDPAFAPGTGTPEIGGLASWQVQAILRRLEALTFTGMDIVEVAPAYDSAEITALAAATMVWEYLAMVARPRA
ncbi:agmatinase [Pseudorhodoplanes sp.]|uniref:agmatinase n=1 Tax=Pseudorhodoplanes sp. TaxID=1934341 RepID=UPI002CBD2D19|nr:agmatinase [Pseudorhodoplanes sp.]HWV55555.1 agmatinase [Pseudorhodoplanes sp.]